MSEILTKRTFNQSIGILLRTDTRAINKQEGITGSLFRKEAKAVCLNYFKSSKSNFSLNNHLSEKQYPQICFNYIHKNPVMANLTKHTTDWEFSST